jgi:hypothetical protein
MAAWWRRWQDLEPMSVILFWLNPISIAAQQGCTAILDVEGMADVISPP